MFEIIIPRTVLKTRKEIIEMARWLNSITNNNTLEVQPFFDAHPGCKDLDASGAP